MRDKSREEGTSPNPIRRCKLAEMSSPNIGYLLRTMKTIILPMGSLEGNGPHLPVSQDLLVAEEISRRLSERTGIPVAPTIPWGTANPYTKFPGTVSLKGQILAEVVKDICRSYKRHGANKFLILNMHVNNIWPVNLAIDELKVEGIYGVQVIWWSLVAKLCMDIAGKEDLPMGHGGEIVTSVILAIRPDLVDMSKAVRELPKRSFQLEHAKDLPAVYAFDDHSKITRSGITGNPLKASKEKGEEVIERCLQFLVSLSEDLKSRRLDS